jgi:hypothetical protein
MKPPGASGRFSTWLARTHGCANQRQNRGHDPADLPERHTGGLWPPTATGPARPGACQIQLRESQGHDPTPAFKLLRGADMRPKPEQILFQKVEEMLFRET